jgi:hypothetical protein
LVLQEPFDGEIARTTDRVIAGGEATIIKLDTEVDAVRGEI